MIRILQIIHGKHFGGAEKVVFDIAAGVDKSQFRCAVVCLSKGHLWDMLKDASLPAAYLPMIGKLDLRILPSIIHLVKQYKINVIQSHTSRTNFLARLTSRFTGIPNISTIHSPILRDANLNLNPLWFNAWLDRWMAPMADLFVPVSQDSKQYLVKMNIPNRKIKIIHNGVTVSDTAPLWEERDKIRRLLKLPVGSPIIGMVAQLRPRKGAEYLILAAQKVKVFFPDVKFIFVGGGEFVEGRDYIEELKALAYLKGVSDTCRFVGFQDNVRQWIQSFDMLVLPSLFGEGLPLSLLEGMACGLTLITTDTEGNREVVQDGINGYLVPPRDVLMLAERIIQLIQSPFLREEMGTKGFALCREKFSLQAILRQYEETYQELSSRPK